MADGCVTEGVKTTAEGFLRSRVREGDAELARIARIRIRFAPVAWLVGVGLLGFGVEGMLGAGVALMLPSSGVFVGALFDPVASSPSRLKRRKRRTLRHRWFLWLDQQGRKLDSRKQLRLERKEAEQRFLDSRRGRAER
jgi:hypothetical protein